MAARTDIRVMAARTGIRVMAARTGMPAMAEHPMTGTTIPEPAAFSGKIVRRSGLIPPTW
jgi:hypothetical protein